MRRFHRFARLLTLATILGLSLATACGDEKTPSAQHPLTGQMEISGGVVQELGGTTLDSTTDLGAIVTLDAPRILAPGQHFSLRLTSDNPPGLGFSRIVLHPVGAPWAIFTNTEVSSTPVEGGVARGKWSAYVSGALARTPKLSDQSFVVDIAFVDNAGNIGRIVQWNLSVSGQVLICPQAAACGARTCGPDPLCGTPCGSECEEAMACTYEGACAMLPQECPQSAECSGRECGVDAVCGESCGTCAADATCNAAGLCEVSENTDSSDESSNSTSTSMMDSSSSNSDTSDSISDSSLSSTNSSDSSTLSESSDSSSDSSSTSDSTSMDTQDPTPITFSDSALNEAIHEQLGIAMDKPITVGQAHALEELVLTLSGITNLSGLEHFTQLKRLHLPGNRLTNISALTSLTQLRLLDLSNTGITNFAPIAGCTSLEELRLRNLAPSAAKTVDFGLLAGLAHLQTLDYSENHTMGIATVSKLSHLTHLLLTKVQLTEVPDFAAMSTLEYLDLSDNTALKTLNGLEKAPKLRNLFLGQADSSVETFDLSPLADLIELVWLDLGYRYAASLEPLRGLTKLQRLRVNPWDASAGPLRALIKLEELEIHGRMAEDSLPWIGELSALRELAIYSIAFKTLNGFESLTKLEKLDLQYTNIGDLTPISSLPRLKSLQILGESMLSTIAPLSEAPALVEFTLISGSELTTLAPLLEIETLEKFVGISLRSKICSTPEATDVFDALVERGCVVDPSCGPS